MCSKDLHREMIDNIEDYSRRYTIVRGICDIVRKDSSIYSSPGSNYVITNNDYWIMLGNLSDEAIVEVFDDSYFGLDDGVTRDGCYEYRACIYYESGSWNEPGELYCTKQSAELYIDYIDFVFVESFESRIRNERLDLLLGDTELF